MSVLSAAEAVVDLCRSASAIHFVPMRQGEPERSIVIATDPLCEHLFPFGMDEVIDYYRRLVAS